MQLRFSTGLSDSRRMLQPSRKKKHLGPQNMIYFSSFGLRGTDSGSEHFKKLKYADKLPFNETVVFLIHRI
jgi:hypothetical protein